MCVQYSALIIAFCFCTLTPNAFPDDVKLQNAPESNRCSLATLLQRELARTLDGKKFKSGQVNETVEIGSLKLNATAQAEGTFDNPKKELKIEIPELTNLPSAGLRMKCKMTAPIKLQATASAGILSLTIPVKGKLNLEIEADIKLSPKSLSKVKADVKIQKWTGTIDEVDLGNSNANEVLAPMIKLAVKKFVDENREKLQEAANNALKKASEEGSLEFDFLPK